MFLALVFCFDYQKSKEVTLPLDGLYWKGRRYVAYAVAGYTVGLVAALATGILTRSPQPALLYLVLLQGFVEYYCSLCFYLFISLSLSVTLSLLCLSLSHACISLFASLPLSSLGLSVLSCLLPYSLSLLSGLLSLSLLPYLDAFMTYFFNLILKAQ